MEYSSFLTSSTPYTTGVTLSTADASVFGAFLGAFAGVFVVVGIIGLIITVLTIIAQWKIFTKAGEKGWKSIIPIYNLVILFKIIGINPLWILGYLAAGIPVIGQLFALGLTIYAMYKLALAFGKDGAFTIGLVLLNTIFVMILAFGSAEYQLPKEAEKAE